MNKYTPQDLLSHINAILEVATEQENMKDMKMYIMAAQHKLDLLREKINE